MLLRYTLLWLLMLVLAGPLQAKPVSHFTLDNGLELVVIEDRRAPVAVHMVWYRVGSADEPAGRSGIAHFLEHLMFKGTENRAPGEFSALVEAQGGRDNAFTSFDFTGYFQRIAADRLEMVMELEADRMANLSFTEAEWLPERSVILEERGQILESRPQAQLNEQMRAALFQNHRYGIPIIGWRHEMAQLTGDHAMEFYARHYGPNNAIVVIAGDVGAEDALRLAQRHYGPIPRNPDIQPIRRPQEPPQLAERRLVLQDARVGQPLVSRMYLAPVRRSGDQAEAAALQMLAALLGGSARTSVLERALVIDEAIALSAWAGYNGTARDYGVFSLGIAPADGVSLAQAEAALDRVVAGFLESGPDADALERVRVQIRAAEIFGMDDAMARAREFGTALSLGLTVADVEGWLDALLSVEAADIMAAARAVLDRNRAVTGWLTPPDALALQEPTR